MELHPSQTKLMVFLKTIDSLDDVSLWHIARETGLKNAQNVSHHLLQLEKKGYIRRSMDGSGHFELLRDPIEDVAYVNVLGFAQCGNSADYWSTGNVEDRIPVSTKVFGISDPKNIFAVWAKGDSMEPMISEGDLVFFRKEAHITSGSVALVLDRDEPKIKSIDSKGDVFVLSSINKKHDSVTIRDADEVSVLGYILGVIRGVKTGDKGESNSL